MTPEIIDRQTARALGLKRYFTGKPCPHGHVSERLASDANCKECKREQQRTRRKERCEQDRESDRLYYLANREKRLEYSRRWHLAHREERRESRRRDYLANPEKFRERERRHDLKLISALRALKELGITF